MASSVNSPISIVSNSIHTVARADREPVGCARMLSAYCSGLAWSNDYEFFAAVFAAASLMALIMAVPRVR